MYNVSVNLYKNKGGDFLGNNIKKYQGNYTQGRVWEIDFFRGIALLLMIYFHLIFDLKDIYGYNIDYTKGFNAFTGRAAGTIFILVSGISCIFSRSNVKRGIKILALAMLISLVTYFYNADMIVKFGVLHFLGVSILLYSLLERMKIKENINLLVIIATIIFVLGNTVKKITPDHDYFFILGITSDKFVSADYYPLVPWLGIFIYGVVIGKALYKDKKSAFKFSIRSNLISWIGRYTLPIYIIHQPLIILIIGLILRIKV